MNYGRVMLKLSGEALAGSGGKGYDEAVVRNVAQQVKVSVDAGVQVGIVTGGGNYWRGRTSEAIARTKADQIGMLATIMNCIYVSEIFRTEGMKTAILSPFICGTMTELFSVDLANRYFNEGTVVFFAGGTGHPYFSTDTGIALRAVEVGADAILLAKSIDGVYTADPRKDPTALKLDEIRYTEVLSRRLQVMDSTATSLAMDNNLPVLVFALADPDNIRRVICGEPVGTYVH